VYDVTEFAPMHPGGRAIYSLAGRDASDVFTAFHEPTTWGRLKEFKIGTVKVPLALPWFTFALLLSCLQQSIDDACN
jgi:cytochrome b involved in lipid metabolism